MIKKLHNAVIFALNALIRGYAYLISPLLGAKCRFYPTCSCYMQGALAQHGLIKGIALGILRLLRCHPWYRGDMLDPVPAKIDWGASLRYKRRDTIKEGSCLCADPDDHRKERP